MRLKSTMMLTLLSLACGGASADYTFQGTSASDKLYYGYTDNYVAPDGASMGAGALFVRRTGRSRHVRFVPLGSAGFRGTLYVRGGDGDDVIRALHETEEEGLRFDDIRNLRYTAQRLYGDRGNDHLSGSFGVQVLYGGPGHDYLAGSHGDDRLYGGSGMDVLFGGPGNDLMHGGADNDQLIGGAGDDQIDGGTGEDIYRCRSTASLNRTYDNHGFDRDWMATWGAMGTLRNVEHEVRRDPYRQWATIIEHRDGVTYQHLTTSNVELLRRDRALGAVILGRYRLVRTSPTHRRYVWTPMHTTHKQYCNSCGPNSLNMVMEYLGRTDRSVRVYRRRRLGLAPRAMSRLDWQAGRAVDVGYRLSPEHIAWLAMNERKRTNPGWDPDPDHDTIMDGDGRLNTADMVSRTITGSFFGIRYNIGNVVRPLVDGATDQIQTWLWKGAHGGGNRVHGLPFVANRYSSGDNDARFASTLVTGAGRTFQNLAHLKAVIKAFIDNRIPLVVSVERGGHFNTLIGYRESGGAFWVYTADPLDGWGRPFHNKPMRWRRYRLTLSALNGRSGALDSIMLYAHAASGYRLGTWARDLDRAFGSDLLCGHLR